MARFINDKDSLPLIDAANAWVRRCLINDGSVLGDEQLWTLENLNALDRYFVQNLDAGSGGFYEKLKGQLHDAPDPAKRLMAEILWALFLFPSNISIQTKRESLLKVWSWSGEALAPSHPMLADAVLRGIGSGGMGINNHRWRELVYIIGMATQVKGMDATTRQSAFADYDHFMAWIDKVPQDGERQFRQMLRYFMFPDQVERMSSNRDRIKILAGFGIANLKDLHKWSDEKLDSALLKLRQEMEAKYDTKELDFYCSPLREVWKAESEPDAPSEIEATTYNAVAEGETEYFVAPSEPKNLILYGPPGTGKTYRLQRYFLDYTDQPADVDRSTWEFGLVARFGWRATIAAALATIGRPAKVAELTDHPLIRAKALQRERTNSIRPTLWGYLQEHTSPDVETVNTSIRRPPFVFTKNTASEWSLAADWRDADGQAVDLADAWKQGPEGNQKPVQRYRFVTFHPSYSYEDFVIGLRPVATTSDDDHAQVQFRMVDGVFKQICTQAKANPSKRYALFIDEINRGNIAKVFGELITLVEGDKRARYDAAGVLTGGLEVQLPGTDPEDADDCRFGVPANLDIYGTMNTADRSIALLDIALRRRFEFEALFPLYDVIDRRVEGVDLGKLLRKINDRLEYLADRDRQIGHAYFSRVKSLDDLRACFCLQIIPLLQEYFFDDWSRVSLVLSGKGGGSPFLEKQRLDGAKLFEGNDEARLMERERYVVTDQVSWTAEAFQSLYESQHDAGISQEE